MSDLTTKDPLDMPAGEVDTRFPRLQPDKIYRMIIRSPEKKTNDKGTEMLVMKLETTKEAMDTDKQVVHPGFKFSHRIIHVSGERDIQAVAKDSALLLKAVFGAGCKHTVRSLWDNPALIADAPVDVRVGIQKEKDGFPESNTAKFVIPA